MAKAAKAGAPATSIAVKRVLGCAAVISLCPAASESWLFMKQPAQSAYAPLKLAVFIVLIASITRGRCVHLGHALFTQGRKKMDGGHFFAIDDDGGRGHSQQGRPGAACVWRSRPIGRREGGQVAFENQPGAVIARKDKVMVFHAHKKSLHGKVQLNARLV